MCIVKLLSWIRNIKGTETFLPMETPMQNRDRNRHGNPWNGAPLWARDLAEMVFAVMMQNEDMLALLRKEVSNLSDEDRAAMSAIVKESAELRRKLDDALK